MPSKKREQDLFEVLWVRVEPLLPLNPPQPKGGRRLRANGLRVYRTGKSDLSVKK